MLLMKQVGNADNLQTFRPNAFNDHGQRAHGFAAIAAAIMQKNDVAASQALGRRTRRQIVQDGLSDLFRRAVRIFAPVVGINLVADG